MGEIIVELFIEIFYEFLLLGFFKILKYLGLLTIKIITFNPKPFKKFAKDYEGKYLPYWVGFIVLAGMGYLAFLYFTN